MSRMLPSLKAVKHERQDEKIAVEKIMFMAGEEENGDIDYNML